MINLENCPWCGAKRIVICSWCKKPYTEEELREGFWTGRDWECGSHRGYYMDQEDGTRVRVPHQSEKCKVVCLERVIEQLQNELAKR